MRTELWPWAQGCAVQVWIGEAGSLQGKVLICRLYETPLKSSERQFRTDEKSNRGMQRRDLVWLQAYLKYELWQAQSGKEIIQEIFQLYWTSLKHTHTNTLTSFFSFLSNSTQASPTSSPQNVPDNFGTKTKIIHFFLHIPSLIRAALLFQGSYHGKTWKIPGLGFL